MIDDPTSLPSPRRPGPARYPLALVLVMACASGQTRCNDDTPTTTSAPPVTTGPATTAGSSGEIDDSDVLAVDRALQDLFREIYRDARRASWKRQEGPGSLVYTLEYSLAQAHSRPAAVVLEAELLARGFEVDRVLDDERVTTVFAAHGGFPVIVTVDIGAKVVVATVERAGP